MSRKALKRLSREELEAMIPRWYDVKLHVAAIGASIALVAGVCVWQLHRVRAWELCAFGGALVFFNAYEYFSHRFPFHTRSFGDYFYSRHTIIHHGYFTREQIGVDTSRGYCWVLMPPFAFLVIVGTLSPVVWALAHFGPDRNLGWLFLLAVTGYYLVYEVFHTLSHLPESHPLARSWVVRTIAEHHHIHHDPKLMNYNFAFFFPVWDYLMGTKYHADRAERRHADLVRAEPGRPS